MTTESVSIIPSDNDLPTVVNRTESAPASPTVNPKGSSKDSDSRKSDELAKVKKEFSDLKKQHKQLKDKYDDSTAQRDVLRRALIFSEDEIRLKNTEIELLKVVKEKFKLQSELYQKVVKQLSDSHQDLQDFAYELAQQKRFTKD